MEGACICKVPPGSITALTDPEVCAGSTAWLKFDELKSFSLKMTESLRLFVYWYVHGYCSCVPGPKMELSQEIFARSFISERWNQKWKDHSFNYYCCFRFRNCDHQATMRCRPCQTEITFYLPGESAISDKYKLCSLMESCIFFTYRQADINVSKHLMKHQII